MVELTHLLKDLGTSSKGKLVTICGVNWYEYKKTITFYDWRNGQSSLDLNQFRIKLTYPDAQLHVISLVVDPANYNIKVGFIADIDSAFPIPQGGGSYSPPKIVEGDGIIVTVLTTKP